MNPINLPPWLQTALTAAAVLAFAASTLIRLFGLESYPWARRLLRASNDVLGAAQVRAGDLPSVPEKDVKEPLP